MASKGKKLRVSKVKRGNQKRTKLSKQGKLKTRRHKAKPSKHTAAKPVKQPEKDGEVEKEEESDHGEDMLKMVDKEDLGFLKNAITNRSYSIFNRLHYKENLDENGVRKKRGRTKTHEDDDKDDLEKEYEEMIEEPGFKKTKLLLPIKTKDGVVRRQAKEDTIEDDHEESVLTDTKEQEESDSDMELVLADEQVGNLDITKPVSMADLFVCREEVLQRCKFRIGVLSSGLLENPQQKLANTLVVLSSTAEDGEIEVRISVGNLKTLLNMLGEKNPEVWITVRKLAAVSLLEVFKDILPSYHIKEIAQPGVKFKKTTLELQGFERELLRHYKSYLQKMERIASIFQKKKRPNNDLPQQIEKLGELAINCLCDLLVAHPYFNFSKNLVQMLVPFLNCRLPSVRQTCAKCFKTVFREDKRGQITLDIVRRINHLVKSRSHSVHCEVLSVFLVLRIKDVNLDKEKEDEIKQKKFLTRKQKLLQLSKRERKRSKKLDELEKELLETKAEENKKSKGQSLTEITKFVFTIYFRVLKSAPSSKLLSITLEGLAKFAHCINLDFYHDLVEVLNRLVEEESLGYRAQLHCVQTVFTILSGQGDVLNIDPSRFYRHLYKNLLHIRAGRNHGDLLIVLQTLDTVLIRRRRKISQQRVLAFTKRLATMSTQLLHNGALGCLALIKTVMQLNTSVDILLDPDSTIGQGIYFPELDEPEYCNANSTALWELLHLRRHYHPTVRKFSENILKGVPSTGEGSLPPHLSKLSADQLFTEFDPSEVVFHPAIPVPKNVPPKARSHKRIKFCNEEIGDYVKQVLAVKHETDLDFRLYSMCGALQKPLTVLRLPSARTVFNVRCLAETSYCTMPAFCLPSAYAVPALRPMCSGLYGAQVITD
uniref:Nucleolar complex protein 3 homolog n=1 Tax=Timema shepardi TaxID=629360 RepID=A0A7R9FW65_TIMSH|nr:unnamed protein product [Timema shepardi]